MPSRSVVRQHAREFVESYFGVGDIAAITYTSGRVDASQDFTSDAQLLLASIDKFMGRGLRSSRDGGRGQVLRRSPDARARCPPGRSPRTFLRCRRHAGRPDAHAGHERQADGRLTDFDRAQRVMTVLRFGAHAGRWAPARARPPQGGRDVQRRRSTTS